MRPARRSAGSSNGTGCTSTASSFAVGLGSNATASATGLFSGAVANGVTNTGTQFTIAQSTGNFDFAYAGGPNTLADANGTLGLAVAQGSNLRASVALPLLTLAMPRSTSPTNR